MASSNYDYEVSSGLVIPDTSDLLTIVQDEFKAAFGSDLNINPETPQGVLIQAEVAARSSFINNNVILANEINPNFSGGVFLDAIWALMGGQRVANKYSQVLVNMTGEPGTFIPLTVQGKDSNGNIFQPTVTTTLSALGTASVLFKANESGPISVLPNTLTNIVEGVLGLETINNPTASSIGALAETDQASRIRRRQTLALQGDSLPLAITSALYDNPDILSIGFLENVTDNPITVTGGTDPTNITLVPHSIYVCVEGGSNIDIATVLLEKKSGGCNYNGSIAVVTVEPVSGQSYTILFDRPIDIPILAQVYVKNLGSVPDPSAAIKKAILDYAAGLVNEEPGFIIGGSVSCFQLAGAITLQVPGLFVTDLKISLSSPVFFGYDTITTNKNQLASIIESSISVFVI